jgi:hypothetical protein
VARQLVKKPNEEKKWKIITLAIIFLFSGIFIWSFILLDKTFFKTSVVLVPSLIGGAIGTILFSTLWSKNNFPFWVLLFFGVFTGTSVPTFLIASSNYYFKDDIVIHESLDIIRTGNYSKRKSACKKPYAVVFYRGIEKEILFTCDFEKTISNYKKVSLELSKGFLGFYVIRNSELIK